jgi:proline iminopeptidase
LNLLGHSFGGLLGMYYSIKYPKKVSSLILVDPDAASFELRTPYQIATINSRLTEEQNLYLDSLEKTDNFKNYDPEIYTKYYRSYLTTYFANPSDTSKLKLGFDSLSVPKINRTNSKVRMNLGEYDIHDQISAIKCKTLIMQGTESVFSVEGAMAIQNKIPKSEIHLFKNCGHFEYIESPEKFRGLILDFYKKN